MASHLLCFIARFTLNYIVLHDIPLTLTMQYRIVYRYLQLHCWGSNYLSRSLKCTLFTPLLCSVYPIHCTVHGILSLWPKLYSVLRTAQNTYIYSSLWLILYPCKFKITGLCWFICSPRFIYDCSPGTLYSRDIRVVWELGNSRNS